MKATLEFSLPEEADEHKRAVHAADAWCALYDLDQELRNLVKHGTGRTETAEQLANRIRTEITLPTLAKLEP